ncbi:MAG: DUF86 domain-containing protein [Minisyncoccia bacterium]
MVFQKMFVMQKIDETLKNLDEARELFKFSDDEILKDSLKYHTAERLLQLIVDLVLDVNYHFIKELNLEISDDLQSTFYTLGENNILPENFSKQIAPVVGLRNRIVHRYESLDKDLFIKSFRKNYSDFEMYLKYVGEYVKN